jgi:succinoglycan biosynthesis protein ExoA
MTNNALPIVTIIMPIRNEVGFIGRSLSAVVSQDYPADHMEILVADGQSGDGTSEIVGGLVRQHQNHRIHLLNNPKRIFSTGFNIGVSRAQGEVIVMLGGHTEIAPDYIKVCVEHLVGRPDIACVGGFVETIAERHSGQTIALAMRSFFGVGGAAFRTQSSRLAEVDTVAFGAYRRSVFQKHGLLDEEMVRNQDDEFNYRLRERGGRILLVPDIHVRYYSRSSPRSLWSQYFQYGYWKVRVLQKHPCQMQLRQFVPPIFLASLLIAGFLALFFPFGRVLLVLVACSYLLANLVASIWIGARSGWEHLLLSPLVYAILHISYGSGFLVGLVKFANRWGDKQGKVPEFHQLDA